jgi:hypothetical protein
VASLHVLAASWPRPVPTRSKCIFRPSVAHHSCTMRSSTKKAHPLRSGDAKPRASS